MLITVLITQICHYPHHHLQHSFTRIHLNFVLITTLSVCASACLSHTFLPACVSVCLSFSPLLFVLFCYRFPTFTLLHNPCNNYVKTFCSLLSVNNRVYQKHTNEQKNNRERNVTFVIRNIWENRKVGVECVVGDCAWHYIPTYQEKRV